MRLRLLKNEMPRCIFIETSQEQYQDDDEEEEMKVIMKRTAYHLALLLHGFSSFFHQQK